MLFLEIIQDKPIIHGTYWNFSFEANDPTDLSQVLPDIRSETRVAENHDGFSHVDIINNSQYIASKRYAIAVIYETICTHWYAMFVQTSSNNRGRFLLHWKMEKLLFLSSSEKKWPQWHWFSICKWIPEWWYGIEWLKVNTCDVTSMLWTLKVFSFHRYQQNNLIIETIKFRLCVLHWHLEWDSHCGIVFKTKAVIFTWLAFWLPRRQGVQWTL